MLTSFLVNHPEMIVKKSEGLTLSEKKLVALGYQTFLRLWSYPNPYKLHSDGQELCDLLVVFDNHIIIFSDKDCDYKDSGNPQIDWMRWYKRAILKSANQLIGAKNWIARYPDRIAIDAKCSQKFPLKIEITPETKFHLIAIAHGAAERCKSYFGGGDGGLLLNTRIVGDMHISEDCEPFCIGKIFDPSRDFIHVFDDASYANVLHELDTIRDFIAYLDDRKTLLLSKGVIAESENDILAQHLRGVIKGHSNALQQLSEGYTDVCFEGGMFEELKQSKEYLDWHERMRKSYFWDDLLQKTFFFIENGLSEGTTSPTIQELSKLFEIMACEDRAHRYCLSDGFLSFLSSISIGDRGTRMLLNPDEPDLCYLLLLLPRKEYMTEDGYRKVRKEMLLDYCAIVKAENPGISHIIGVAHESNDEHYSSEDFLYFDASEWSLEQQEEAIATKREYEKMGILGQRTSTPHTFYFEKPKMKGRDRNKPCPCGSGKKFKNCCGK